MSDLHAIADRIEIEALCAEFTDADGKPVAVVWFAGERFVPDVGAGRRLPFQARGRR